MKSRSGRSHPVRYRLLAEAAVLAVFPSGERLRLPSNDGVSIADLTGAHQLMSLRMLSSMLHAGDRLLVLGCGDGFVSQYLARQVRDLSAVDWREEWLSYAALRYRRPNMKYLVWPEAMDSPQQTGRLLESFTRVALFNPLLRGFDRNRLVEFVRHLAELHGSLPLFWSERLPVADDALAGRIQTEMAECLDQIGGNRFRLLRCGHELCAWPQDWLMQYEAGCDSLSTRLDLMGRVLERTTAPLLFGPGIPDSWPGDFLLLDHGRSYGRWQPGEADAAPLFSGADAARIPLGEAELICASPMPKACRNDLMVGYEPRALWCLAEGDGYRQTLRQQILPDLKKGRCAEGYDLFDEQCMMVRTGGRERLPLYPLFDATVSSPGWLELRSYLEWTKKKALLTITPQLWMEFGSQLQNQEHRALLILVGFSQDDIGMILPMAAQGWRIGLGADQPMDQVPLKSFETFRLLLEGRGIITEALWMGTRPPDPAYMKNIHSRFGRLLISTRSIQRSWDSKRVRFCLTLCAGDDFRSAVQQGYFQMAGIDELQDYRMLYSWASALEKAGQRQAAKALFTSLSRSRSPKGLEAKLNKGGVLYHLGRIAEGEGDISLAIRRYSQCLAQDPEFCDASERLSCLRYSGNI